jgi:hypothetical protein
MGNYVGIMEPGVSFTADKPFVMLGWPTDDAVKTFDSENEARQFLAQAIFIDGLATFARLYCFSNGKWNRLH